MLKQVARRFSDFVALDASIRASQCGARLVANLPAIPSAFTLSRLSDTTIAHRKAALHTYVTFLTVTPELTHVDEVDMFFGGFYSGSK